LATQFSSYVSGQTDAITILRNPNGMKFWWQSSSETKLIIKPRRTALVHTRKTVKLISVSLL